MADNENDFWGSSKKPDPSQPESSKPDSSKAGEKKSESGLRSEAPQQTASFWGKGMAEEPARTPTPEEATWGATLKAKEREQAERDALLKDPDLKKKRRRKIVRRVMLGVVATLLLVVVVCVAFLPQIAGGLAPSIAASKVAPMISGKLDIGDASLSWGGPQMVNTVRLLDAKGKEVARASVQVNRGLWALATGGLDLGEVTVTKARADIVRDADGTTNLQRAIASPSAKGTSSSASKKSSSEPPSVPAGLDVKLIVKKFDATFTDNAAAGGAPLVVTLRDADLTADVAAGKPLKIDLAARAVPGISGATGAAGDAGGGTLSLVARIDKWSKSDGRIDLANASGDVTLTAENFPVELIDTLVPLPGEAGKKPPTLRESLGKTLHVSIVASGTAADAKAQLDVAMDHASVKGALAYASGVVTTTSPVTIKAGGEGVRSLVPAINTALASQNQAKFDALPDMTLTLDKLKVTLPQGGQTLDLRGSAGAVDLKLGEMTGQVFISPSEPAKPFKLAPLTAHIETADLGTSVHVTAATSATVQQQPAGDLNVDLTAGGVLDAKGAPVKGLPARLAGHASIKGIASAIAQPFVSVMQVDLPRDLGPTIDLEVAANSDDKSGLQTVDLTLRSQHVAGSGSFERSPTALVGKGDGLKIDADTAGAIASRFVKPDSGWKLSPEGGGGGATILVKGINVPIDPKSGVMKLDQAAGTADVILTAMTVVPVDASGARRADAPPGDLQLNTLHVTGILKPGGDARAELSAACAFAGAPFDAKGAFDIKKLLVMAAPAPKSPLKPGEPAPIAVPTLSMTPVMALRPSGQLELHNLPASLAGLFVAPAKPAALDEKPLDLSKLIADSLGGTVAATIATKPVANDPSAIDLTLTANAPRFTCEAGAVVNAKQASIRATTITTTLAPQTLDTLLRAYAPSVADSAGRARLAGPARVSFVVDPLVVPIGEDQKPKIDAIGIANVTLSLAGQTLVEGLVAKNDDGTTRDIGRVGVENLTLKATVPVAALLGPARPEEKQMRITINGRVLGNTNETVMQLTGELKAEISRGTLAGGLTCTTSLTQVNTGSVEHLIGKDGLLTGLLGDRAQADANVQINPPAGGGFAKANIDAQLNLTAPRLKSDAPIKISLTPDRIELASPAKLTLEPDPAAANKFLAAAQKDPSIKAVSGSKPAQTLSLDEAAPISVTLSKLSLPRAVQGTTPGAKPVSGPARPGAIKADLAFNLTMPKIRMTSGDGTPITLTQGSIDVNAEAVKADSPSGGPPVRFRVGVSEATVGSNPAVKGMALEGAVTRLFSPTGAFDISEAIVSMTGDLPAAPTALVDALLNQKGLLLEALGPVVSVKMVVERVPLATSAPGQTASGQTAAAGDPPLIDFKLNSDRASVTTRGTVRVNGATRQFISDSPLQITVTQMTKALSERFIHGLPMLGDVEKSAKEAPALITATGLTLPLNGDLSGLNADVTADPGECTFHTSSGFASILKVLDQKTEGSLGKRLDAVNVKIRNGIATYDKWKLPVGQFTVETEGTADFVNRQVDVITWIPFGGLSDSAAGAFNTGIGSLIGKAAPTFDTLTMVPFRTKGSFDHPETRPDLELAGKTLVKQLSPQDLIKKGLGNLLQKSLTPK